MSDDRYRVAAGEKAEEYGHPADFYALVRAMYEPWDDAFFAVYGGRATASTVYSECLPEAIRMILWKVARLVHSPRKRDTIDDIIGYAETLHMMLDREESDGA